MSAIIVAGNEIIPDTLTVTVDGTEITAKDFQKVLLNINQASATASVADGTDLMQKMEIINKNANACDVSFKGEGGATVKNLKQNQSMRLSWTGSFWYVTFGGLLSGVANDGTPFNYTTEVTLDEVPVNTTYTTTEQDTGMTWIDGKKIYRKVITGNTGTLTYGTTASINLDSDINYDTSRLIHVYGTVGYAFPLNWYYTANYSGNPSTYPVQSMWLDITSTYLRFIYNFTTSAYANAFSNKEIAVIVEYTKTTD